MKEFKEVLIAEKERLENVIEVCNEQMNALPDGRLEISVDGKYTRFFQCTEGKPRTYIGKSNSDLPRNLAQKSYNSKVFRIAKKRKKQIDAILEDYDDDEIEKLFTSLHHERKNLVTPVEKTWEQLVDSWQQESYIGKGFSLDAGNIYTEKGERVRSKSEKILADYFARNDILYKYEKPINLKGYGLVYPDFTILSKKTRGELLWEHFGMMDEPSYAEKVVKKINAYCKNGIVLGKELIATFETKKEIIDTSIVEHFIKKYIV